MKDQEFIELLNLYLDHEITAADARRLEAEIRAQPKRRELYLEYCRMQKACGILAEQFVAERAPTSVRVSPRRSFPRAAWIGFGSFAAIAACVALALFFGGRRRVASASAADSVASVTTTPAAGASRGGVVMASLSAADLRAPIKQDASAPVVAADSLEWLRSFQVNAAPTLPEPVRFEPAPDLFRHELRAVPTGAPQAPAAESAAFRFQR